LSWPFPADRFVLMAIVGEDGAAPAVGALDSGADLIQVRAKHLAARRLSSLVSEIVAATGRPERIIVNSRPDIAAFHGCLGVHLPETGLDVRAVRAAFPRLIVGASRHDRAGMERGIDEGIDYAVVGPVFATPGKELRALGIDEVTGIAAASPFPVIGVGGVEPARISLLKGAGLSGGAALRPFAQTTSARTFAEAWRGAS
jgi:thiamine-phosphate diphosphorylase